MIDIAAANLDAYRGCIYSSRESHSNIRALADDAVISIGKDVTRCSLITAFIFTAAYILDVVVTAGPKLHAVAPIKSTAVTIANHNPKAPIAMDRRTSGRVSIDLADALTFEARWNRETAAISAPAVGLPHVPLNPVEHQRNATLLGARPLGPPQSWARSEITFALDPTFVATSTPALVGDQTFPADLAHERQHDELAAASIALIVPTPEPTQNEITSSKVGQAAPQTSAMTRQDVGSISERHVAPKFTHNQSTALSNLNTRTAIYDITARTVYLPNGLKLEAHSGFGDMLDDPRYVGIKDRGPTPPNVYDLTLRERLFHGIPVIRLNPVGDGNMFNRNGILIHPYMLSANGQ